MSENEHVYCVSTHNLSAVFAYGQPKKIKRATSFFFLNNLAKTSITLFQLLSKSVFTVVGEPLG